MPRKTLACAILAVAGLLADVLWSTSNRGSGMSWLQSLFGRSSLPDSEQVFEKGMQLIEQGDAVEARARMKNCVDRIRSAEGDRSLLLATALFRYATLAGASGDHATGAELCRDAADACPDTHEGKQDRLTYLMNQGQVLSHSGRADEAVPVLETSLQERLAFYGEGHAGVAYGQQILAEALLATGRYDVGLDHASAAASVFGEQGHQEFPGAFALWVALASASGHSPHDTCQDLPDFPEDVVNETFNHAWRLAALMNGPEAFEYLRQLDAWCEVQLPDEVSLRINTVVTWSNLATDREDNEALAAAAARLLLLIDRLDSAEDRAQLLQGVALSYSTCGRSAAEVAAMYELAVSEARTAGLPVVAGNVERNWAIFEADNDRHEEALRHYESAMTLAKEAGRNGEELLGRTLIAKGIVLQHHDQADEARPLLREGIDLLPATHEDASCGILHQVALENSLHCPCHGGDSLTREALSVLARRFFEGSGFADMLEHVSYGEDGLNVRLSREPSYEEITRLQIAHTVFVNQVGGTGH